jgi:predicted nucleotide-binding protein
VARINAALMAKIQEKSGLSRAGAYARVTKKAGELLVPNHLAALVVARDLGMSINRYGTQEQLAALRGGTAKSSEMRHAPQPVTRVRGTVPTKKVSKAQPNTVFVVHGRDVAVADSLFQLLRAVGLDPIEWNEAVGYTKNAAPTIYGVIQKAFERAVAAVILFTPDEQVQLREHFRNPDDDDDAKLWNQARPNVFFEAGIALALRPKQTVLVEVGKVRSFTDIAGMHVVRLSQSPSSRNNLVVKLRNAGCKPNTTGNQWMTVGNFTATEPNVVARSVTKRRRA